MKADGTSVRVCGDYKVSINQVSVLDRYPVPKIDDPLTSLAEGNVFTKVEIMNSINSEATIEILRQLFARYGIPKTVVSDNGATFTSATFQEFMKGIRSPI